MNYILVSGRWYGGGGTESFTRDFAEYLTRNNNKVFVVVDQLDHENYSDELKCSGKLHIKYINKIKHKKTGLFFIRKTKNYLAKIDEICKNNKIDFVFAGDKYILPVYFLKLKYKFKIVLRTGGITAIVLNKELDLMNKNNFLIRNLLNLNQFISYFLADKIISMSNYELKTLRKYTSRKDIKVIYHGIDCTKYTRKKITNKKKLTIGYFGRFCKIKNPEIFFRCLQKVQKNTNFNILWCGDVQDYNNKEIKDILKKYEIKNFKIIPPAKNQKKQIANYKKIDIFFATENIFGIGRSILEAASMGLPIVAINKAKLPIGYFVSTEKMAISKLQLLLKHPNLRKKQNYENHKYIYEHFNSEKQYNKITKYILSK